MLTCKIKWVDNQGNPTPDNNEAIMLVRTKSRIEQHHGRAIQFNRSEWFPICACHAEQLNKPGMHIWECKELDREEYHEYNRDLALRIRNGQVGSGMKHR